ncbi:putative Alpha/beta hydrolase fold-3 domain protein [metagenome]|uniref:Putative Alpha/beta hydrolase fold-3 domain protein n=1 Tax=metagenome TaxID=256318 RepID=A0A2P2BYV7_9ZZZZ
MIEVHPRSSHRSRLVRLGSRAVVRPALGLWPSVGFAAPLLNLLDVGMRALPRLPGTQVEAVDGGDWAAELITASTTDSARGAIVYFHGGAFVMGGLGTHRRIAERVAQGTGLPVLSVAYRQHGRGHVDTSIADCVAAVNWLIERGIEPERIVVAGDSAGGHLAFAVALAAVADGVRLAGIVALSPWLEFDNTSRRRHRNARRDDFIPAHRLQRVAHLVTGTTEIDPARSPVNASLRGLPPVLMMCAADEVLRYDAELMTERLDKAGVPVQLHIWEGQVHAFPVMADLLPEGMAAIEQIVSFTARVVAPVKIPVPRAPRAGLAS